MMPEDGGSSNLFHRQRPLPVDRSVFWYPLTEASQPRRARAYLRFITLGALREMADHIRARPSEGRLGFLIGELYSCPDTNARYVVVDAIVPSPHPVRGDRTVQPITLAWPRLEEQLNLKRRHLLGWYHTHPEGGLTFSSADVSTHLRYFSHPWQMAILLEPGIDAPLGVVCRPGKEWSQNAALLPFYELLEPQSLLAEGVRRTYFRWHDYQTDSADEEQYRSPPGMTLARPAPPLDADLSRSRVILPDELDDAFDDDLHGAYRRPRRRSARTPLLAALAVLLLAGAAAVWKFVPWGDQAAAIPTQAEGPAALESMVDPILARLDQLADEVAAAARGYQERARLFDSRRMTCADLTRGMVLVEGRWTTYNVEGRSRAGTLDPERASRDETLYADVQEVERHFRASQCPPP